MGNKFTELNAGAAPSGGSGGAVLLPVSGGVASGAAKAGEAVINFGEKLRAAKVRSDNVLNTVRRARAFKEFSSAITGEMARLETEGDPTDPALPGNFGAFMKEEGNRILGEHREAGADDRSMSKLTARFIDLQGSAAGKVGGELAKQRKILVEDGVATNIGAHAIAAGEANDPAGGYADVRAEVAEAEDVFKPQQEAAKTLAGYATVTTEVFNKRAEFRDLDGMKLALNYVDTDPATGLKVTAKEALGAEAYRKLRNRIVTMEYDNDKGVREGRELKARVKEILSLPQSAKLDLGDPDTRELLSMDRDDTEPGIKDMETAVALWKKVNPGKTPDEATMSKMRLKVIENRGLDIGDGDNKGGAFGTTLRGRSMDIVNQAAQLFASGDLDMSSLEGRTFTSAVLELQRPVQVGIHPITKLPVFSNGTLPPHLVDAYKRANKIIPRPSRSAADGGQPVPGSGIKPNAVEGVDKLTLFDGSVIDPTKTKIRPDQTLYGRLDKLTGIGSGVSAFLAESTIGSAVGFTAEEEIKARSDAKLFGIKAANALTKDSNVRAQTERQNLIEKMDIEATLAEEGALRPKMFAVADLIISIIKKDANILSTLASPESQRAALSEMRSLNFLLAELGVPILVNTAADIKTMQLQPGTVIRTPSGNVGTVAGQ
jgi:hypothetical protein